MTEALQFASLVVAIASVIIAMVRISSGNRQKIFGRIDQTQETNIDGREILRREVGEAIASVRQQNVDTELFMRDNFVRKDDFTLAVASITETIKSMDNKQEARFFRLETEIRNHHQKA